MIEPKKKNGLLVTFEGIDGAGKSTQADMLCGRLKSNSIPTDIYREPGSTDLSSEIRKLIIGQLALNNDIDKFAELLLFMAARAQLVNEKLYKSLSDGKVVILDRFIDSSLAYQGYGLFKGKDGIIDFIKSLNEKVCGELNLDLTFYLDIDFLLSRKRLPDKLDKIENRGSDFYNRVISGYRKLADDNPGRIISIDASKKASDISDIIFNKVMEKVKEKRLELSSLRPGLQR